MFADSTWWSVWPRGEHRLCLCLNPTRSRSDPETPLLFVSNEARGHQPHQARKIAVRQPMTRERTRALDQIA
jgi:hypothetical protein